ncbi:G-patch domain and KOW motifs-containing protein-like [Sorex fumeus]|uniref:G-patch domain and KOW motifs-containing protein-like n=1 Tax=Sorex fumeus TaxID=62283 RepID=UPI0024AD8D28|nr:G-patch domain and KOW motifs-containing protein-like [Sorex fumeus]
MADSEEGDLGPAAVPAAPVSFSFSRKTSRRRLADSGGDGAAPPEEKDFLKGVEGRELLSVKPPESRKPLAIPVPQSGPRRAQPPAQPRGQPAEEPWAEGVLAQAVKELIEESRKSLEERESAEGHPALAIPVTQEGAGSEPVAETRPEEANYEAVPVEAYGLAMLRGMGWKPGEGIGRTFRQVVKPRVNALRPKGLGLGANLMEVQSLVPPQPQRPSKPSEERRGDEKEQPKELVPGGAVVVLSGPHRGLYGKVEGLDPDNARAMVRLAARNCMVTVSEYCLRPVSQQEFDKNSDPGQVDKTSSPAQQNGTGSRELNHRENSTRKRKHLPDHQGAPVAKVNATTTSRTQHWLHRDLRVRFVDKQHKGGQYYNTKMTIEDVLSPDTCVCRTDEGHVLEGLREDMLETLVPRVEGHRVMVVLGPQAGKVGRLLGRDQAQSRAMVQLQRDIQLLELHYDSVCQYVGPSDIEDD